MSETYSRLDLARQQGTYEIYRARITTWLTEDELTNAEVAEKLGVSPRMAAWICQVLAVRSGIKRNRFSANAALARRQNEATELWAQRCDESAIVSAIRTYTAAWDRGW